MDNFPGHDQEEDQIELPPGFRFHPSDEELITHYLFKKVINSSFSARAIGEVDMNKVEPWELPLKAKMGENEWYFFCVRDKKYPTGLRTNRATAAGYWKATGKDKEIFRGKSLVGMKKTLVFYQGRAPKGEKSNWVIHEYRLDGKLSVHNLPKTANNEWVICRVYHKSDSGKKDFIPNDKGPNPSVLPPLMDSSVHVPCFSNQIDIQKNQKDMMSYFNNPIFPFSSNSIFTQNSFPGGQSAHIQQNFVYPMQNPQILRGLFEHYGPNMRQGLKTENEMISLSQETDLSTDRNTEISSVVSNLEVGIRSFKDQEAPSTSVGPGDFDCIWNC